MAEGKKQDSKATKAASKTGEKQKAGEVKKSAPAKSAGARTVSEKKALAAGKKNAGAPKAASSAPLASVSAKARSKSGEKTKAVGRNAAVAKTSGLKSADLKKSARPGSALRSPPSEGYYGNGGSIAAPPEEKKGFSKNKKAILAAIAAALALLLILGFVRAARPSFSGSKIDSERKNTLALAKKYLDKGQYDKAMDLLNGLLIANPDDDAADELLDRAIQLKKAWDEQNQAAAQSVVVQPGDSSYNINIDTDELTAALREQNERSQQMINELLEQQRQNQNAQREEAAAERRAAEELKKKEEAERKVKEAELAQKSAALKSKINGINENILAGKAELSSGNVDGALKNFEGAVSSLPIQEGEPEFSASKYSEIARSLYDAAANEKDPVKKDKLKNAAMTYVNKALGLNPGDASGHFILGMSFGESSPPNWSKAAEELEKSVKSAPENYIYWYHLGRAKYRLKDYERARTAFQNSANLNKGANIELCGAAYFNLGMTNKQLKLNKDALNAFRKAHETDSQNSKAWLEEARLLHSFYKDSAGAVNCYKQVIAINPGNVQALNELGVVYSSMGQFANAEASHRKAVALLKPGDKDPVTYYNLSLSLYNQKKNSEAERYARLSYEQKDAVQNAKERAVVVYNYALVEESLGKTDEAITLYKEVLSLDPNHSKSKTNLGVMFLAMNDPDTALLFFEDAYKIEKSFELENNLGSAYLAKKDYAKSVSHFQNAVKERPKDNTVRFNLAQAYSGAGEFDNAKTTYLEILNSDPNNYDSYIELAKVFVALKDPESAQSYLKILQQKNPTYKKSEVDALLAATSTASSNER